MQEIPTEQNIPAAWYGADMAAREEQWLDHLSQDEVAELEAAARDCLGRGLDIPRITAEEFVLPGLGPRLALLRATLLHGIGFAVLRACPSRNIHGKWRRRFFLALAPIWAMRDRNMARDICWVMCAIRA